MVNSVRRWACVALVRCAAFFCVVATSCQVGWCGDVPTTKAISVMESLEKKIVVVKWNVHCVRTTLRSAHDTSALDLNVEYDKHAEVTYDPVAGRYKVKQEGVQRWVNGAAPLISGTTAFAFDGEIHQRYEHEKGGKTAPTYEENPGFATISRDVNDVAQKTSVLSVGPLALGLAYMPPHCWIPGTDFRLQPLSRQLREWVDEGWNVAIEEDGGGVWTIRVVKRKPSEFDDLVRIRYDPTKGGVVADLKRLTYDEKIEHERVEIELQESKHGIWLPQVMKYVNPLNKWLVTTRCEAVDINFPITADTFRLEFPKGTRVDDEVQKMYYVVGRATDNQSKIREFMRMHRLTGEPPVRPQPRPGRSVAIAMLLTLIVAFVVVVAVRCQRSA